MNRITTLACLTLALALNASAQEQPTTQPSVPTWSVTLPNEDYQVTVRREGGEMTEQQIIIRGISQMIATENEVKNQIAAQNAILLRMEANLKLIELHLSAIKAALTQGAPQ